MSKPSSSETDRVSYFGLLKDGEELKSFGILDQDRHRHMYILGKTGMGKSTMLHNMCLQDIYHGKGVCFIDPHGDSAEYILDRIPLNRRQDVIYFNPADTEYPVGINVMRAESGEQAFLISSGLMSVFKRIWAGMWSSRMEYILNNTLLALLERDDVTMLSVVRMLSDEEYAKTIVAGIANPLVKNFWTREYANFHDKYRQEAVAPILNKIGQFFSTEITRNILGQKVSSFSFRDVIDNQKILIVNLSKGRLGEDIHNLLGSLIVTKLQLAGISRADTSMEERVPFNLYVDEFHNITTDSFASILSEARKYGLNLILAHQYIDQLLHTNNENVRNAIFGNVGSMVMFTLGSKDASRMAKEMDPEVNALDLISLHKTQIACKLSIRGRTSQAFLAKTMSPIFEKLGGNSTIHKELSRRKYGRPKRVVNAEINKVFDSFSKPKKSTPRKRKKPKNGGGSK